MERNYKIDNLKAILIFFCCLGPPVGIVWWSPSKFLYLAIYSFHMPAFVYTTGYFCQAGPMARLPPFSISLCGVSNPLFLFPTFGAAQTNRVTIYHPVLVIVVSAGLFLLAAAAALTFDSVRKENRLAVVGTALLVAPAGGAGPYGGLCLQPVPDRSLFSLLPHGLLPAARTDFGAVGAQNYHIGVWNGGSRWAWVHCLSNQFVAGGGLLSDQLLL